VGVGPGHLVECDCPLEDVIESRHSSFFLGFNWSIRGSVVSLYTLCGTAQLQISRMGAHNRRALVAEPHD
jgi:hypothetical protein